MKALIVVLIFIVSSFAFLASSHSSASYLQESAATDSVMICNSVNAVRYHRSICEGLANCNKQIVKVTVTDALKGGFKACGYCYKKRYGVEKDKK